MQDFQESPQPADDFEVEVSDLGSEAEDDAEVSMQVPLGQGLARKVRTRRLLLGASVLLALLLVFASVPTLRSQVFRLFGGAASSTPGALSDVALTPRPQPGQGWIQAGPPDARWIAFAPGKPEVVYTCGGLNSSKDQSVPISVEGSHDAGSTWQALSTPASGVGCDLTINPTNAQDVVLLAILPCDQCPWTQAARLYRTLDGGKRWSAWSLPPTSSNQTSDLWYCQWIWIGSTLVIAPFLAGDSRFVRLATSVAERPLLWIKTVGLFDGAPADASINSLFVAGPTLYVQMFSQQCTSNCDWFMQSHDKGVSWSPFNPLFQGQQAYLLATGGDGHTLLGEVSEGPTPASLVYVRSGDGGATWDALPPLPQGVLAGIMTATPEGTVYAAFDKNFSNAPNTAQLGI